MTRRRVVVTGMGVRSPLGSDPGGLVAALRDGRSGITSVPDWDSVTDLRTRVGGIADGGDPSRFPREIRRTMGRVGLLALGAMDDAIIDSGLPRETLAGERCWLLVGSTLGALADVESMFVRLDRTRSVLGAQAAGALRSMAHTAAISCALHLGFRGRLLAPSAACATGSTSVGMGYEAIRDGRADFALAGGADELHVSTAAIFDTLQAASSGFNDAPSSTPRPFDRRRDGVVCAEGAGFLVLESMEHALARGARIHGEVLGFASNSSGSHATTPDADAIARCMSGALGDAEIDARSVSYVNAHATGTTSGDAAEARAIASVLGSKVAVSSSKGHLGHTMAAAGSIETILCFLTMREGFLHPTLNLEDVAPDCAVVDHVRASREAPPGPILKNNFALGGINTCLVLGGV
jgi:3-oxoacyl-[acyl-carrier-protein] synthase II